VANEGRPEQIRRLARAAQRALDADDAAEALLHYQALEGLAPLDGAWPRGTAECHRRLGQERMRVDGLARAAERYARAGDVVRALAMSKMLGSLDPANPRVERSLERMQEERLERMQVASPPTSRKDRTTQEHRNERPTLAAPRASMLDVARRTQAPPSQGVSRLALSQRPTAIPPGDDATAALIRTPLFDDVDGTTLRAIIAQTTLVEVPPGQRLMVRGEPANALFVVVEGRLAASVGGAQVATLSEGDFFGEIGLLSNDVRQADVTAVDHSRLLRLGRPLLEEQAERDPDIVRHLLRSARDRLVTNLIKTNPMFAPFEPSQARELTQRFDFVDIDAGTEVITEGEPAAGLYVLLSGRARALRASGEILGELGPGDIFGELSMLNQGGAVASVVTSGQCFALLLPDVAFRQLIMMHPALLDYVSSVAQRREAQNVERAASRLVPL